MHIYANNLGHQKNNKIQHSSENLEKQAINNRKNEKKKKSFFPLTWSTKKDMLDWTSIDPSEIYWIVSFGK